jgi:hypothetical protein
MCFLPPAAFTKTVPINQMIRDDLLSSFEKDIVIPPGSFKYQEEFAAAAQKYDMPLPFILAVARGESFFRSDAVSSKGAIGLMQVIPGTAKRYGYSAKDLKDPKKNIDAGVHYLADIYDLFNDPYLTLGGYYCGEGALKKGVGEIRTDCDNYVQYIHTHLNKVMSKVKRGEKDYAGVLKTFVLAEFSHAKQTDKLMNKLRGISNIKMDKFRQEGRDKKGFIKIRYQLLISYGDEAEKKKICAAVKDATAFDLCR